MDDTEVSTESSVDEGQSFNEEPSTPAGQPEVTPEQSPNYERDYKELQAEFTRRNQATKALLGKFDSVGGVEEALKLAELRKDPAFKEWESQRNNPYANADADTQKAVKVVEEIAQRIADGRVNEILQRHIAPLVQNRAMEQVQAQIDSMDSLPEMEGWREYEGEMAGLVQELFPQNGHLPVKDQMIATYMLALIRAGKMEEYQSKQYESKLRAKKAQSQGRAGAGGRSTTAVSAGSMEEAFFAAKRAVGI